MKNGASTIAMGLEMIADPRVSRRPGRVAPLLASLLTLAAVSFPALPAAADSANAACRRVPVEGTAGRFESTLFAGAFVGRNGDQLVLLNPFQRSFKRLASDREVLVDLPSSLRRSLDNFAPRTLWNAADGHLVAESKGFNLMEFDHRLLPVPPMYAVPGEAGLARVVPDRWGLVGRLSDPDAAAIVCGDVQERAGGPWKSGLFYVPVGREAGDYKVLADFRDQDPRQLGCRLDGQVIAVVDGQAFVLLFSQPPEIRRVEITAEGARLGAALDLSPPLEAMKVRPPLPTNVPIEAYPELMLDVEGSALPVELIGWEGALYLLLREPGERSGATRWSLARIGLDGSVQQTGVDSTARHMTMVPGKKSWVFIEKGRADWPDKRNVEGLRFVPSERIRGLTAGSSLCK